jgi:2-hydroxy-3-keto-5-methylthiopentenyl-1-phosphate phosphatase
MANLPSKVEARLVAGIKKFQPILTDAQKRDVNESDTVIIITDMLSEIFGYDKYSELTSEKNIRGSFCDLATKVDNVIQTLIEAKAINQELKDGYVRQAVDYASNEGVDWVVLTSGVMWRVYKVTFTKPIDHELILGINFLALNQHTPADLEQLFLLTKESWAKSALSDYYDQKQALSKFSISAVVLSDSVLTLIRRELRRLSPDVKIDVEQIRSVLEQEVLKREVVEGEKAEEAHKRIARASNRALKTKADKETAEEPSSGLAPAQTAPTTPIPSVTTPPQPPA